MKELGAAGLPPVLEKESYCQYLLRIDRTAGLLAESIRTVYQAIPYMLESRAKVLGRRGSGESVCVEDLTLTEERYCRVWEGILQASGNVQSETLLRDVLSASIFATGKRHHSGGETIDRRAAARIVRRHDAGYLGNRLQNAADILRCARKPPPEGAIVAPQATAPEKEVGIAVVATAASSPEWEREAWASLYDSLAPGSPHFRSSCSREFPCNEHGESSCAIALCGEKQCDEDGCHITGIRHNNGPPEEAGPEEMLGRFCCRENSTARAPHSDCLR